MNKIIIFMNKVFSLFIFCWIYMYLIFYGFIVDKIECYSILYVKCFLIFIILYYNILYNLI